VWAGASKLAAAPAISSREARFVTLLSRIMLFGLAATLVAAGASFVFWQQATAEDPELAPRAFLPLLARDTGADPLPPANPSYCEVPANPTAPPASEAVLGTLRIGGADAPAGTVVQVFFDGKAGPAIWTTEAGGYRVLYDVAGGECSNKAGAAVSVRVAGQTFATGAVVGGQVALRFDISVP
jgi:hypothetical protein